MNNILDGIKAIYFDLDDTLCAYLYASRTAIQRSYELHKLDGITTEQFVQAWRSSFDEVYEKIKEGIWYPQYLESGEPTRTETIFLALQKLNFVDRDLAKEISHTYQKLRLEHLELFPGAQNILELVYNDYSLGLITNGPKDVQNHEIDQLNIRHYFSNIFIEGEQGIGKPEKIVFQRARNAVGLQSNEILMIGNNYGHDILPAIEIGWKTVFIQPEQSLWSDEFMPLNDSPVPNLTLQSVHELLPVISKNLV
jgi:putative hydrolase of the HAD superfamily